MSKFIKALHAEWTGNHALKKWQNLSFGDYIAGDVDCMPAPFDHRMEYIVKSEWREKITCMPSDLERMLEFSKRKIANALYGEFIDDLYRLQEAVYDQDSEKCNELIASIMKRAKGDD